MRSALPQAVLLFTISIWCFGALPQTGAPSGGQIIVSLRVEKPRLASPPPPMAAIRFDSEQTMGNPPAVFRVGKSCGGILVGVQALNDPRKTCRVKVDANRNGDLADDEAREILPESSIEVLINRPSQQGRQEPLPYFINYDLMPDGQAFFSLPSNYWAAGELTLNGCKVMLVLLDQNEDGLFDKRDFVLGQSVGLDRDGDGRIGSFNEWLSGKQIIEVCGKSLLMASVEPDGSAVTLVPTSLRGAQLDEPAPPFSFTTLQGKTVRSEELKGKVVLLDFWAS